MPDIRYMTTLPDYKNQITEYFARGYEINLDFSNHETQVFTKDAGWFSRFPLYLREAATRIALLFRQKLEQDDDTFLLANLAEQGKKTKILKIFSDVNISHVVIDSKDVLKNKVIKDFINDIFFENSQHINTSIEFISHGENWKALMSTSTSPFCDCTNNLLETFMIELSGPSACWQLHFDCPSYGSRGEHENSTGSIDKISKFDSKTKTFISICDSVEDKKGLKIQFNKIRPILNDFITAMNYLNHTPHRSLVDLQCKVFKMTPPGPHQKNDYK